MSERELTDELLAAAGAGSSRLRLAIACAILASLAAIALLGISGWFLTSAAIAGAAGAAAVQAFNYLLPSAGIRFLAIVRTAARYGERLLGHEAALRAMAELRTRLFSRRAAEDSRKTSIDARTASATLLDDIAALEDIVMRRPAWFAGLAGCAVSVAFVSAAGVWAAIGQAAILSIIPLIVRRLTARLTDEPARLCARQAIELRTQFSEFAASRSEIAAYGLSPRIVEEMTPSWEAFEASKQRLLRGEAMIAAVLSGWMALAVGLVFVLGEGSAAIMAMALLASGAGVEAMTGFTRNSLRQSGIEQSLSRLGELSKSRNVALKYEVRKSSAERLSIAGHTIEPGERVAITGISGSGKTRLIEALAGMREAAHPAAMHGVEISELPADRLRRQFALAPQEPMLLVGTIEDNLRVAAPGLTMAQLVEAIRITCLEERVRTMPDGLFTWLGAEGGFLSGGERKRLSLARALLARRPWLLLDEPTEGLDAQTEAQVISNLGTWLDQTGTGLLLVSHRPEPFSLTSRSLPIHALECCKPTAPVT